MRIMIEVEVPDGAKCDADVYCQYLADFPFYHCALFNDNNLESDKELAMYYKCPQCLQACKETE